MCVRGFTLIELMVTVAIIVILATIAIPTYQDYTIRARVTEGLTLASTAELAVNEYTFANNQLPATQADTYYTSPLSTSNVSSIVMGSEGVITITYTSNAGNGSIILTPTLLSGALIWDCTGGTLNAKYRPASCR
jgi:type IV pilus assembly protein PilA